MSRIAEIYDKLNTAKASMQELHDFVASSDVPGSIQDTAQDLVVAVKSQSKVANWRLWLYLMAKASWDVEQLFTAHKAEVTGLLSAKRPHTLRWYAEESKKFQYGYGLTWIDNQYKYEYDDPDARIIKYAAASESNSKVVLKVAKEQNGVKQVLSAIEKSAFITFWSKWKDAGVSIEVVSLPPDVLKIDISIVRDRLVLNHNNLLLRDNSINPIELAIQSFGNRLEFDGIIRLSKLVDAIQSAEGIVDVKLNSAHWKPEGGTYSLVNMYVTAASGYFILSYQDSTFNYTDNVNVEVLAL